MRNTDMLNHWVHPGDIRWREILKIQEEDAKLARLVIPLRVVDELDRQKYGQGDLARKAQITARLSAPPS